MAYETGPDWIKIQFIDTEIYKYSYAKAGRRHIEQMKSLAQKGIGLATYINQHVKNLYD